MKTIPTHLFADGDDEDVKSELKEALADNFGLFVENDEDILEIILNHDLEFDIDDSILINVFDKGIALASIFIPYTNIGGMKLIPAT